MHTTSDPSHPRFAIDRRAAGLTLAVLLLALAPSAAAVRKCVDAEGRVLFTDQRCPPGTRPGGELDRPLQIIRRAPKASQELHPRPLQDPPPGHSSAAEAHPRTPNAAERPAAPMMAKALVGARFAKALSDLTSLKTYSLMHFAANGDWPRGPEELGLDPRSFYTDEIVEVGYRRDGGIVAYLASSFGPGKWIQLQPRSTLGGANVSWGCRTNLERSSVLGFGGSCESEPARATEPAAPSLAGDGR